MPATDAAKLAAEVWQDGPRVVSPRPAAPVSPRVNAVAKLAAEVWDGAAPPRSSFNSPEVARRAPATLGQPRFSVPTAPEVLGPPAPPVVMITAREVHTANGQTLRAYDETRDRPLPLGERVRMAWDDARDLAQGTGDPALAMQRARVADNPLTVLANAYVRGKGQFDQAVGLTTGDAAGIARATRQSAATPASRAMTAFQRPQWWAALRQNPQTILAELLTESSSMQAPGFPLMGLAMKAGGPAGGAAVAGAQSFWLEQSSGILQAFAEEGVDLTDPDQVAAALADTGRLQRLRATATKKAIPVALFDAASVLLAGQLWGRAGRTVLSKVLAGSGELAQQGLLGMAGEGGGQLLARGRIYDTPGLVAEGLAELPSGALETAGAVMSRQARTNTRVGGTSWSGDDLLQGPLPGQTSGRPPKALLPPEGLIARMPLTPEGNFPAMRPVAPVVAPPVVAEEPPAPQVADDAALASKPAPVIPLGMVQRTATGDVVVIGEPEFVVDGTQKVTASELTAAQATRALASLREKRDAYGGNEIMDDDIRVLEGIVDAPAVSPSPAPLLLQRVQLSNTGELVPFTKRAFDDTAPGTPISTLTPAQQREALTMAEAMRDSFRNPAAVPEEIHADIRLLREALGLPAAPVAEAPPAPVFTPAAGIDAEGLPVGAAMAPPVDPTPPAEAPAAVAPVRETLLDPAEIGVKPGMQYKREDITDTENAVTDALKGTNVYDVDQGGSLTSKLARHMRDLGTLSPELLGRVQSREIGEEAGAGAASVPGLTPEARQAAFDVISKQNITRYADARRVAEMLLEEQQAGRLVQDDGGQLDMFGGAYQSAQTTFAERVKIENEARRLLTAERSDLLKPVGVDLRAGEVIDAAGRQAQARQLSTSRGELTSRIDLLYTTDSTVKAEIIRLAGEVANGRITIQAAARELLPLLRSRQGTATRNAWGSEPARPVVEPPADGDLFGGGAAGDLRAEPARDIAGDLFGGDTGRVAEAAPPAEARAANKRLWEMTANEFEREVTVEPVGTGQYRVRIPSAKLVSTERASSPADAVAIVRKKYLASIADSGLVADDVLAEYPDLFAKYGGQQSASAARGSAFVTQLRSDLQSLQDAPAEARPLQGQAERLREVGDRLLGEIQRDLGRLSSGLDPVLLGRVAAYGAVKIAEGLVRFADWSAHMVEALGEQIRPHLDDLWARAQAYTTGEEALPSDLPPEILDPLRALWAVPAGQKPRKFAESVATADYTAEETTQRIIEAAPNYTPISNEQTMADARARLDSEPRAWDTIHDRGGKLSAEDIAVGEATIRRLEAAGDFDGAARVAVEMAALATQAGQVVQALSMIKRLTPAGMLQYAARQVRQMTRTEKGEELPASTAALTFTREARKALEEVEGLALETLRRELNGDVGTGDGGQGTGGDAPGTGLPLAPEGAGTGRPAPHAPGTKKPPATPKPPAPPKEATADLSPEELLARAIQEYVDGPKAKEAPPEAQRLLQQMVSELYAVARQVLPKRPPTPNDPYRPLQEIITDRARYGDVWAKAQEIVGKAYAANPQVLQAISAYLARQADPVFSDARADSLLRRAMQETGIKLGDLVRDFYASGEARTQTLVEFLRAKTNLTGEDAAYLDRYIRARLTVMTEGKKRALLEQLLKAAKVKVTPDLAQSLGVLTSWSNLGAFDTPAARQVMLGRLPAKVRTALQRWLQGDQQTMADLVQGGLATTEAARARFRDTLAAQLQVKPADADLIINTALTAFDEAATAARTRMLKGMAPAARNEAVRRTVLDRLLEVGELNGFGDPRFLDLVQQIFRVPTLTVGDQRAIGATMRGRVALQRAELDGPDAYRDALEAALTSPLFTDAQRAYWLRQYDRRVLGSRTPLDALARFADYTERALLGKILGFVADKQPVTTGQRILGLQRILMLLNARTQVRNVGGNVLMQGVANTAEAAAVPIDRLVSLFTKQRTATLPDAGTQGRGLARGLQEQVDDFRLGTDTSPMGAAARFDVSRPGRLFRNRMLQTLHDLTVQALALGDRPFYRAAYDEALRQYQTTRGLTEVTPEAEAYATQVALERTYQDVNAITDAFTALRKSFFNLKREVGVGNVVLPFAKTPANILARALDYAVVLPLARAMKAATAREGFDQATFAREMGKSVTGAGLLWAGFLLASSGLLTGKLPGEDRKRRFLREAGYQDFAVNLNGKSYSWDWAQPVSILIAIGASLANQETPKNVEPRYAMAMAVVQAIVSGGDTLFNLVLLSGLRGLTGGNGGSPTENLLRAAVQAPLQAVPTLAGQIARTIDPIKRDTYTPSGGTLERIQDVEAQTRAKVPLLSRTLPPALSGSGEVQRYEGGALGQFVAPWTVKTIQRDALTKEMLRVNKATGEEGIFPGEVPAEVREGGVPYAVTPARRQLYLKTFGTAWKRFARETIRDPRYRTASDAVKALALKDAVDDARDLARQAVLLQSLAEDGRLPLTGEEE